MKAGILFLLLAFQTSAVLADSSREENEAIYKLIQISDRRDHTDPFIERALSNRSPRVLAKALSTLGHIAHPQFVGMAKPFLNHSDSEVRSWAAFALSQIDVAESRTLLQQAADRESSSRVKANILKAIGNVGDASSYEYLKRIVLETTNERVLLGATHGLGILLTFRLKEIPGPETRLFTRLLDLSTKNSPLAVSSAFALSRLNLTGAPIDADRTIQAVVRSQNKEARALLCRVLGKSNSPQARNNLASILQYDASSAVRVEAARAISKQTVNMEMLAALRSGLTDAKAPVVVAVLGSIQVLGDKATPLSDALSAAYRNASSSWVKAEVLKTFALVSKDAARAQIYEALTSTDPQILNAAIVSLSVSPNAEDLRLLKDFLRSENIAVVKSATEALLGLEKEQLDDEILASINLLLQSDDLVVITNLAQAITQFDLKLFAANLALAYSKFKEDEVEAKMAILGALGKAGSQDQLALIDAALSDPIKQVVEAAAAAHLAITNEDVSNRIPLNTTVNTHSPSFYELRTALRTRIMLKTNKGNIVLRMFGSAPLNAANFVKLVRHGFYDGKTFHRVVPNFVVQGGDPRGDGYGGPGYMIRDEYNLRRHDRGTVGIATAGKDTGGSQIFINTAPNLHLDGHYTLFARVTQGMDVADQLTVGDQILQAYILE